MEYKGFTYTPTPKTAWDNLSMLEKSEMMRVAVKNGITDLKTIREKYNEFAEGGGIHIKDSKKGTFTAAAKKHGKSVQAFASQVLAHPENYSPAMRKKANFARNASHWKHGLGGYLQGPMIDMARTNMYGSGGFLEWLKGLLSSDDIDEDARNLDAVLQHKKKHKVKNTSWYIDPSSNTGYRIQGDKITDKFEIISGLNTTSDGYTDLKKDKNGQPIYSNEDNLRSTGAGIFTLSRAYDSYGEPMYLMQEGKGNNRGILYKGNKERTGRQTNQAIHAPANEQRAGLLANMNDKDNKITFGCISPGYGMLRDWTQQGLISPGDTVYVQPTVEGNYLHYDPNVGRIFTHYQNTPSTVTGKNQGVKYKLNNVRYNKGF